MLGRILARVCAGMQVTQGPGMAREPMAAVRRYFPAKRQRNGHQPAPKPAQPCGFPRSLGARFVKCSTPTLGAFWGRSARETVVRASTSAPSKDAPAALV